MSVYTYKTEPLTDFKIESNRNKYMQGLEIVSSCLGKSYGLVIGGRRIETQKTMKSINPANHKEVIGIIHQASIELTEQAIDVALKTFESWKNVPANI
ncbi:MAG: L-glutamate gamma-semialdehyde dehydrogenase, partial [Acholeplasmataceae bacterium]|nr:L-glutamate gamma-semialdehyde dehydrogenase [Acholeplasmataceae bacterium]